MIPLCWVNLPFGQNHPTYLKFVVSMYFAITSFLYVLGLEAYPLRNATTTANIAETARKGAGCLFQTRDGAVP